MFVASAALLMTGIVRGRWLAAWMGWATTAGFALLTGFSVGALVLPVVALLLPALLLAGARGRSARTDPA
ncbi:hypothetical protein ER308_02170 [Egibacter rhizosphaerae]|uniref:Uncharacterized protein n=1 Tax=Egibacter rhizosphaerae TaxID=1670831 RepID=A0A411YBD4_9ACTN|nr:hypothetical protein [Egibacter rhizosphaerae]QBI18488.1 hypothetical protein ER308_02170 [Egibacter rhizosphaerae]